jgi:hypothetical protein
MAVAIGLRIPIDAEANGRRICRIVCVELLDAHHTLLSKNSRYGQGVVQVSNLRITTGATPTLTFEVGWTTASTLPNHRDTVWLFADYRIVNTDGTTGAWTSATITGATATAGTLSYPVVLPGRGFYLAGNPSGAFNATVTVTLAAPANTKFNACVYASDYPPNATLQSGGGYALRGTPPFIINGAITEPSYTFGAGTCITSITDSTGCPGLVVNTSIVTGSILSTGETVCVGGAPGAITSIAAFGGDGQLSYSWYKNGVLIPGATAADYTPPVEDADTVGVYTYTRRVKDQTCNITPLASEGSWALTVEAAPTITLSAASATVCTGTSVKLTATAGAASYSFNGGAWQTAHTTTVTVPATTTYTVKVRSALGCETATAASATVAVEAAPTNIILSAASTAVCAGTDVLLTATAGAASYLFNNGAWQTGNTTNVTVTANATYTVATRSALGCESAAATATVAANEIPAAPTGASNNSRCGSGAVTFSATVPNGYTIDWYAASSGGSTIAAGTISYSPSLTATTSYYAQARNTSTGCVSATRLTVTGTVHPAVGTASIISGDTSNTCPAISVTLNATATGATTFTWYQNSTQVQSGTSSNYSATATGNYTVEGKNTHCVGTTSSPKVVTINSNCVPGCSGFRLYQTTEPYDMICDALAGKSGCEDRGGRMPSLIELRCMCANKATIPGGLNEDDRPYFALINEYHYIFGTIRAWDCLEKENTGYTQIYYIRCVID